MTISISFLISGGRAFLVVEHIFLDQEASEIGRRLVILTGAPTFDLEIVIKPSQALLLASRAHQIDFQRLGTVWVALSKKYIFEFVWQN